MSNIYEDENELLTREEMEAELHIVVLEQAEELRADLQKEKTLTYA